MVLLTLLLAPASARLLPVDEARKDPNFLRFRSGLIRAIDLRDHRTILRMADINIKLGFGGADGLARFRKQWLTDAKYRRELRQVLTHGGSWQKEGGALMFQAPYYSSKFPPKFDPFEHGAILGKRVPLKERPLPKSRTASVLSYDIVRAGSEPRRNGWMNVITLKGVRGYVPERMFGSPVGYRAGFRKVGRGWRMTYFLAGD